MEATAALRELVLTGGPCAGRTTALTLVRAAVGAAGWRALVAPEVATMVIAGGVPDIAADPYRNLGFQRALVAGGEAERRTLRRSRDRSVSAQLAVSPGCSPSRRTVLPRGTPTRPGS